MSKNVDTFKADLKEEWRKARENVKRLRDEIKVKLHLANLDAKQAYAKLEKEADKIGDDITDATRNAMNEIGAALTKLASSLKPGDKPPEKK